MKKLAVAVIVVAIGISTLLFSIKAQDATSSPYDPWIGCWTVEYVDGNAISAWWSGFGIRGRVVSWTFTFKPIKEADVPPRWETKLSLYYSSIEEYTTITHDGTYEISDDGMTMLYRGYRADTDGKLQHYRSEITRLSDFIYAWMDSTKAGAHPYYYKLNNPSLGIRTFGEITVKQ